MWRAHFGRGFGPVVRQTTKWMTLMGMDIPEKKHSFTTKMAYDNECVCDKMSHAALLICLQADIRHKIR